MGILLFLSTFLIALYIFFARNLGLVITLIFYIILNFIAVLRMAFFRRRTFFLFHIECIEFQSLLKHLFLLNFFILFLFLEIFLRIFGHKFVVKIVSPRVRSRSLISVFKGLKGGLTIFLLGLAFFFGLANLENDFLYNFL